MSTETIETLNTSNVTWDPNSNDQKTSPNGVGTLTTSGSLSANKKKIRSKKKKETDGSKIKRSQSAINDQVLDRISEIEANRLLKKLNSTGSPKFKILDRETSFELISNNLKRVNLTNPELSTQQMLNIDELKDHATNFINCATRAYAENQVIDFNVGRKLQLSYLDMMHSANKIVRLVEESLTSIDWVKHQIDFFVDLKKSLYGYPHVLNKISDQLDNVSNTLRDILIFDITNIRYESVKYLVDLKKSNSCFQKSKSQNPELERISKEIKILDYYRDTLIDLSLNLKNFGSNFILCKSTPLQSNLIEMLDTQFTKVFQLIKKYDRDEALKKMFSSTVDLESDFKLYMYHSMQSIIQAELIGIFYFKTNKEKLQKLVHTYALDLKPYERREFFYAECLKQFEKSLSSQKFTIEILTWWRSMVGGGCVCYYIENSELPAIEARCIPEPADPKDDKAMKIYHSDLDQCIGKTTVLLSTYAFQDSTFLTNFFTIALELSKKMPNLSAESDMLLQHANCFIFLENLGSAHYNHILLEFAQQLREKNKKTMRRLDRNGKEFNKNYLGIELAIRFILRFYRVVGDKYITVPLYNIAELSTVAYPDYENIITDRPLEAFIASAAEGKAMPAKSISIYLKQTSYEIHSVCQQEIDPGLNIADTYCKVYTRTRIREAYPGEWAVYPKSIEFFYEWVKPPTLRSPEEIQTIYNNINAKLKRLTALVHALDFPDLQEGFKSTTSRRKKK